MQISESAPTVEVALNAEDAPNVEGALTTELSLIHICASQTPRG